MTIQTGQVLVSDGTTSGPTLIIPDGLSGRRIANAGPVRVFYGNRDVSSDSGDLLAPGKATEIPGVGGVYAICEPGLSAFVTWRGDG